MSQISLTKVPLPSALLVAMCLLSAPVHAQSNAANDICAATQSATVTPEQRIGACGEIIDSAKGEPARLVDALLNRADAYYVISKTALGIADLDRAITLDPKNSRAFRLRAESYRVAGRLDRALSDANESVRLDNKSASAFETRGNVLNNNRQYDAAIEDYNEAIRLDPGYAQAFMDRGAAYYFTGDSARAVESYDEAIKLDLKNAQAFSNRSAAYKKLGRGELALADENEAIRLDPTRPEYFDNRGLYYQATGDYDRAIADFDQAVRLKPQANFLTNRGDAYNSKGDYDRAIDEYNRALQLNPGFYLAYNNRAVAYRHKGDLDHAIVDYEQVLRINPQMASAAEELASLREGRVRRQLVSGRDDLPTFDCASARHAVEKAICSDRDLIRLDHQIDDAYKAALSKLDRDGVARLRREQRAFNARRDRLFGRPDFQLKPELERRLLALRGKSAVN
jgi:tetratricopeptide (TPR) repeat protein